MHALKTRKRKRPRAAAAPLPPQLVASPHAVGCDPDPLAVGVTPTMGVHPPWWGSGNLDDRISKASCYVVLLTFFFGNSAAALDGEATRKSYRKNVRKNRRKTPATTPECPTGYLSIVTQ